MSGIHVRSRGASPWTRADAVKAATLIGVGCLVWAIGWFRVADQPALGDQVAPFNVAILGVTIVGTGQMLWFLDGRRAVDHRRHVLLGEDVAPMAPVERIADLDSFVGNERFYHQVGCAMVEARAWVPSSRAAHERAGRVPCGVCAP